MRKLDNSYSVEDNVKRLISDIITELDEGLYKTEDGEFLKDENDNFIPNPDGFVTLDKLSLDATVGNHVFVRLEASDTKHIYHSEADPMVWSSNIFTLNIVSKASDINEGTIDTYTARGKMIRDNIARKLNGMNYPKHHLYNIVLTSTISEYSEREFNGVPIYRLRFRCEFRKK